MAVVTTIDGTDRSAYVESITRERGINVNGIATVILFDPTGAWRPGERESLVITVDAVDVFVGTIVQISMGFWASQQGAGMAATVQAADGNFLLQRIMYNGIIPAGTLKAALQELPLAAAGVTLDVTQADGPALTEQTFPWTRVDAVMGTLSTLSAYIWRVDETNTLKSWLVGSVASGITFNSANANIDIQRAVGWSSDSMPYVNYQILVYGPTGSLSKTDSFTGDGATMTFDLTYDATQESVYVTIDGVYVNTIYVDGAADATFYGLDTTVSPAKLYVPTSLAPGPTTAADGIVVVYSASFPAVVYSEDAADRAANGDWVGKAEATQIEDIVEAQAYADALRRRYRVIPKSLTVPSLSTEVVPGQTATVTVPALGLSGTYLAIASRLSYARGALPAYETDLISGDERPQHWVEWWQQMGAGGGGGSSITGGGGLTPVSTGPVWLDLGGSIDIAGVTGATSGTARDAKPILGAPYDGRTVTPYATCKVRLAGQSITPVIKDQDDNVISTGSACTSVTAENQTMPSFEMVSGRIYTLRWELNAAGSVGHEAAYLYAS